MNKRSRTIILGILTTIILSACQAAGLQGVSSLPVGQKGSNVTILQPEPTQTPHSFPTRIVTPTAEAVQNKPAALAAEAAMKYATALETGNFEEAASWVSDFSLTVFAKTRTDLINDLTKRKGEGEKWLKFKIKEILLTEDQTILITVTYIGGKDGGPVEEIWPMRQEMGIWHYNWNNLIDYQTLDVRQQSMANVIVRPTRMLRYPDKIQLILTMQNTGNEPAYFGQPNEDLSTFYFNKTPVIGESTKIVLDRLRSYPDTVLEVKGFYLTYPEKVEIRKWKNYQVKPWFTFELTR